MQIRKVVVVAVVCCSLLAACKKDNNKYTYNKANEITIAGPEQGLLVVQRDTIRVNPVITESASGSGPYTYKWEIYRSADVNSWDITIANPATTSTTLSTEKNLKAVAQFVPGSYILQYTVTDSKTNLKKSVRYPITVNGKYHEGWLVMADKGGKAMLSFVRQDDVVFRDVIGSSNLGLILNGKPLAAFSGVHSKLEDVNVFTEEGMYRFSANDFTFTGKPSDLFDVPISPVTEPFYAINSSNTDQYVISNGSVYGTMAPSRGVGKYSERLTGPDGYAVFPYVMNGTAYYFIFYDNNAKRFLYTTYYSRTLNAFLPNIDPGAAFDMSNVGKTLIGADKGPNTEYFLIMKDPGGCYLCTVLPNSKKPAGIMDKMDAAPEINNAFLFAASEVNKQLYYAVANKIYLYDVLARTARLLYTFPGNYQIKDLKMFKGKGWGKTNPQYNTRLVVATYNGTEGELYYFDLQAIGDIVNGTYIRKFGGFDNILQINYRNPNL